MTVSFFHIFKKKNQNRSSFIFFKSEMDVPLNASPKSFIQSRISFRSLVLNLSTYYKHDRLRHFFMCRPHRQPCILRSWAHLSRRLGPVPGTDPSRPNYKFSIIVSLLFRPVSLASPQLTYIFFIFETCTAPRP